MHPLEEWIVVNNTTKKKFAKRAHIAVPTIYKIIDNKRLGRTTAIKIEIATERQITLEMLQKINGIYSPDPFRSDTSKEAEAD